MLDENTYLIEVIQDLQKAGNMIDMMKYQEKLHRNLVYLATVADQKQGAQINPGGVVAGPSTASTNPSAPVAPVGPTVPHMHPTAAQPTE